MSLQGPNLRMTTLDVMNHQPEQQHHPRLRDGIHLRWNPGKNISFPWFGYYLFRRDHLPSEELRCLHLGWIRPFQDQIPYTQANVGLLPREYMITEHGYFISNQRLRLTDDFPPQVVFDNMRFVEVDLADRSFCDFYFPYAVNNVSMFIGFRQSDAVTVKFKLFNQTIIRKTIDGGANQIVPLSVSADAITSLSFSGADAAIVALCHTPVNQDLEKGWEFISGIQYPICLPVDHANYPCPNKPLSQPQAETLALNRVVYGNPADWQASDNPGDPSHVAKLHELLQEMVKGGPAGPPMHQVSELYVEDDEPNPSDPEALHMPVQKPMDLIQMGALDPGVAQMTGLYAVDETAVPNQAYDYLIVADHSGILAAIFNQQGTENGAHVYLKTLLNQIDTPNLDGWICFNRTLEQVGILNAPQQLQAYALPGMTVRDEETGLIKNSENRNSAGLRWDLGLNEDDLLNPDQAVMYELWRSDYGESEPSTVSADDGFKLIRERPFAVVKIDADIETNGDTASDFPPFRLHAFDNYLSDGWYSYKLRGRDLFGRYSGLSAAAAWHQWSPAPDPRPHYYQDPPGNQQINGFAVQLLDLTPPPPPTSTEAVALDHEDPFLQKDTAYQQWRTSIENAAWFQALSSSEQRNMIGLRVRWQWTLYHMRKAPNIIRFNIFYNPGYEPPANSALPASWNNALLEVAYNNIISEFIRPMNDINGTPLIGEIADGDGASVLNNTVVIPPGYDLETVRKGFEHIALSNGGSEAYFRIDAVNTTTRTLTLNGVPAVGANASWRIGLLIRQYEAFLPFEDGSGLSGGLAGLNPGLPSPTNFVPTLEFPKCYANIGVNAVELKSSQEISGNVGASAKIFRVRREKPGPPPALPPDSDKIFASPADYYGNSYYTYRWQPADFLRTHVYRALDESIFVCDYVLRPKNTGDDDLMVNSSDSSIFPDPASEPIWDDLKRQTIAGELNTLNTATRNAANQQQALIAYRQLSNDALRILAGLPHVTKAFQQITIQPLESSNPDLVNGLGPDNPDDFVIDPALLKYIDTLAGKAANRYFYRAAYVDGAENISGMNLPTAPIYLPNVRNPKKPVITKVTAGEMSIALQWSAQNGSPGLRAQVYRTSSKENTRDLRLMGSPIADIPLHGLVSQAGSIDLGAATDVVTVEKVYNAGNFDPNEDWLSGQTATEYLAAPAAPVNGVLNGLSSPDDTAVVAIYTDSTGTHQMTACRNLPRRWTSGSLKGGQVYYFSLIALKTTTFNGQDFTIGSPPSAAASAKPYDLTPPDPPLISDLEWVRVGQGGTVFPFGDPIPAGEIREKAVRIRWTSPDPDLRCLVQYQNSSSSSFGNASGWLTKGLYEYVHKNELDFLDQEYRIKVINEAGNCNQTFDPDTLAAN